MTHQKQIFTLLAFLALSSLASLFGLNRLLVANQRLNSLLVETTTIRQTIQGIKDQPNKNDEVTTALAKLREELVAYRAEQVGRDQILGLSTNANSDKTDPSDPYANLSMSIDQALATIERQVPSNVSTTATNIQLNPGWISIDAFEQPKAGSKIIGQANQNQLYSFTSKQDGWYQIKLENSISAWVQAQFVYETN